MGKKRRSVPAGSTRPEVLMKAVGNRPAALLLGRVIWWSQFAEVVRGGRRWSVFTKAEWAEQIGGCDLSTVYRATRRLESFGLVEFSVRKWKGAPTLCLRPSDDLQEVLDDKDVDSGILSDLIRAICTKHENRAICPNPSGLSARNLLYSESCTLSPLSESNMVRDAHTGRADQPAGVEEVIVPTVLEQLAAFKAKAAAEVSRERLEELKATAASLGDLEKLWRCAWLLTWPKDFVPGWTQRDKGEVNQMAAQLPDGTFRVLLAEVVTGWDELAVEIGEIRGWKTKAKRPSIPTVHMNLMHAVGWLTTRLEAAQTFAPTHGKKWEDLA